MEGGIRVRLMFEDRHILSKSQRREGLKQSWILLIPQLQTISDFSSHLLRTFHLNQSCPHGLLLSMDGFVLPPFESTCILKDKDVICVKKKNTLLDIVKVGDAIEEGEVVQKQPVHTRVLLLANEEFGKETGGSPSETEADEEEEDQPENALNAEPSAGGTAISKKRRASEKLKSPKKKKQCRVVAEDADHTEQIEIDGALPKKNLPKKEKVSNDKSTSKVASTSESAERNNDNVELTPSAKKSELQENGEGTEDASLVPEGTKKVPSRSARRKKAKRRWIREMAKIGKKESDNSKGILDWQQKPDKAEKKERHLKQKPAKAEKKELHWKLKAAKAERKEVVCHSKGLLHLKQAPEKDLHKTVTEHEQPDRNSDAEDNVVPIVIRPGHIRFEPLEEDRAVQQNQVSVETFQWNGITSKKKGQKWGRENFSSSRRNFYNALDNEYSKELVIEKEVPVSEYSEELVIEKEVPVSKYSKELVIEKEVPVNKYSEELVIEKEVPGNDAIDFDKLPPLPSWPKEGDVIAYRRVELSSTWTPELSSFRVGKISYNSESTKIMLLPVPEYPIFSEKSDEDASVLQQDNSLYKADGSLEIDFSALVDVRIVKEGISDPAKAATTGRTNERPANNATAIPSMAPNNNDKQANATTPANGGVNPWDQFTEALNAKKEKLSEENGWNIVSSGRSGWSYRAMRGGALGPTMSLLRSKNHI